jgi:ribosome-associated toxin RatA of RatAB toxin-antitoxin module
MAEVSKTVLIEHPVTRMYELVIDVRKYPEFLPWCGGVEIFEESDEILEAKIHVKFKGLNQYFHTRNINIRPTSIEMNFVDGPFKKFHGSWKFTALREDACKIEFHLNYEFESMILEKIVGPVFHMIAGTFVEGFIKRADSLYG